MYSSADILEAACSIRPYLGELLPSTEAEALDRQLADLLAQANSGQSVDNLIMGLLATQDATREWLKVFLENKKQPEHLRTLPRLDGDASPISAAKFVCPQGDYIWYRPRIGVNPPDCPTHNQPLKPA